MDDPVHKYILQIWKAELLSYETVAEEAACHTHRQMFIEPMYRVAEAIPIEGECPYCAIEKSYESG